MEHPITPPPELLQQWADKQDFPTFEDIATQAACWGADQELEACCEWVSQWCGRWPDSTRPEDELCAARRPKPPSLAEEAFDAAKEMSDCMRAALERLKELEDTNG